MSTVVASHFGVPLIAVSRLERGHQRNDDLATNYHQWLTGASPLNSNRSITRGLV
jgi:hypothetical protein